MKAVLHCACRSIVHKGDPFWTAIRNALISLKGRFRPLFEYTLFGQWPYVDKLWPYVDKLHVSRKYPYFAEYEAKKISRRTKTGLERARAEGKKIGRPSKFEEYRPQLEAMIEEDCSKAEMKRRTGLAYNTVKKYLRRIEAAD